MKCPLPILVMVLQLCIQITLQHPHESERGNQEYEIHNHEVATQSHTVHYNVSYGPDYKHTLDIHFPASRPQKAILLIHGGSWRSGSKEEMNHLLPFLLSTWPSTLVANINYRLGSTLDPGYPKQLEDIHSAIEYLRRNVNSDISFSLIGVSAGGHLSLLYSYMNAKNGNVKAIVNIVGPADNSDPAVTLSPIYQIGYFAFIGPQFYFQNPSIYNVTSPAAWVGSSSPPTISFYGQKDLLIAPSQGPRLHRKLQETGIPNQMTFYSGGHYADWTQTDGIDMTDKITRFLNQWF